MLAASAAAFFVSGAGAFGFEDVAREAEALAARPYQPPAGNARLAALSYDEYRSVRFVPDKALWRDTGSPFQVHFLPLGRTFQQPLTLHEIVGGEARPIAVPASMFRNDGKAAGLPVPGAAGWRLHFPLNGPAYSDEVIVFLGASYFRAVGAGLHYGLSARGLAVDMVGGTTEEFPSFTSFWLERPAPGAREMRFYALLDSPRVTGAYQFLVRPGATTTVDVRARIRLRAPVHQLGIAPLTSMFLTGENQPATDDYRPEVHDSDGLQVALGPAAGAEWLWRPLSNPRGVFVTSFAATSPRGFGLMQRDRVFASYEDLETRYDRRPSAWVEPLGDWGAGRVQLLQFGTPDETHDNIAAAWVPDLLPEPGRPLELAWRVHIGGAGLAEPPGAWVVQSRRGHGWRDPKLPRPRGALQFHVDFVGPALAGLPADAVRASASGNANVRALRAIAQPNAVTGGWRVTIDFERIDPKQAVELRAFLQAGERTLSETWAYALPPE
ncbi:MAG: glucan biosynthesis protein G [Burkholderiales bacterium]|nr:glucan biosynthesis protein G [Burkholderiales bacterium]